MLGAPELIGQLAMPMSVDQAAMLVAGLPFEIASQVRQFVVPPEVAASALFSAHMIIFWLSQDSNVTPPVCLAAFAAAAIAKSPPMATGVQSWKLAKGLYIVPVLFAYTPLLSGDWGAALTVFGFAVVGIYALAASLQGCMEKLLSPPFRVLALACGLACLWPFSLEINVLGLIATVALLIYNRRGPSSTVPVGHG